MSKPTIEYTAMSNDEVADLLDEVRTEMDARIAFLTERRDGKKGPGRPRKLTQLSAADLEPAD